MAICQDISWQLNGRIHSSASTLKTALSCCSQCVDLRSISYLWFIQCLESGFLKGCLNCSHSWLLASLSLLPVSFLLKLTWHTLGADVGNLGPGVVKPSVMGLVFSLDEGATRYAALMDIQQSRVEVIESFQQMMERALRWFIEFQKMPPRRVIFFWDGVSEGVYNTGHCRIDGHSRLVQFKFLCLWYWAFPPPFFSCYQDYHWGLGLSDPCDIHHCGQMVMSFFLLESQYWRTMAFIYKPLLHFLPLEQ